VKAAGAHLPPLTQLLADTLQDAALRFGGLWRWSRPASQRLIIHTDLKRPNGDTS